MTVYHPNLESRFMAFPPQNQLLMICNELNRAKNHLKNENEKKQALYRALELFEFTMKSAHWKRNCKELLRAKEQTAFFIDHINDTSKYQVLINALIQLNSVAFTMTSK